MTEQELKGNIDGKKKVKLNQVFAVMFAYCDPLNCQKIKCAGCHYRYFYEKRRQEIEDDQFSTLET